MRIFNVIIFDGVLNGTTEAFSDAKHNELLGRANTLRFQVWVEDSSGTTPALTVKYYGANDNLNWESRKVIANAQDVTTVPKGIVAEFGVAEVNDGFGRVGLVLDASGKKATVRVTVCGRV